MESTEFNYRKQLTLIFEWLQAAADGFYVTAFQLGLKGELSYMNEILEDGDEIPGDLNYLKSLENQDISILAEMIEDIFTAQQSLLNINALNLDELEIEPGEDQLYDDDSEQHPAGDPMSTLEINNYGNLLGLYVSIWQLANNTSDEPQEIYDEFTDNYFEGNLQLDTEDGNALLVLHVLNKCIQKLLRIDLHS